MRVSWSGHSALITLIRQAEMLGGGGGGSEGVGEGDFFSPRILRKVYINLDMITSEETFGAS